MKKVLLGWVAIAGMLFASSCSKETGMPAASGNEVTLSLNVGVERVLSTRAISDGTGADKLVYQILDEAGAPVGDVVTKEGVSFPVQESVTLIKGKTYKMVAWAQNGACTAYDLEAFPTVSVDYTGAVNNDETRDAFFKAVEFEVYDGMESVSVTLKRPFAQINVGTLEETAVVKSSMVVKGGYSEIDLTDGSVAGAVEEITFAAAAVPAEELKVKATDAETAYKWLSMSYVLINEKENLELAFSFESETGEQLNSLNVPAVPVERNHRTNLLGSFTVDVDFDITTDGGYEGDNNEDVDLTKPGEGGEDPTEEVYTLVTGLSDITEGEYVFAALSGENYYSFKNAVAATGKLTAVDVTALVDGTKLSGEVSDYEWTLTGTSTAMKITSKADNTSYLYSTATNNGMTVGTTTAEGAGVWSFEEKDGNFLMKVTDVEGTARTFAMYNTQDWRSYTSGAQSAQTRDIMVFKKMKSGDTPGTEPEEPTFTVSDVKAEYAEGTVTFSAKFEGEKESIETAYFVYAPATRAAESGKVEAEVGEGVLTATATLAPGSYTVTVEINGEIVESTTADKDTAAVVVPEEEPEQPGDDEKGTLKNPLTVAEAIAKAVETGETATVDFYYIKGRIASVTEQFSANFGNATFTMKDEGSSDIFTAYRVYYKATSQKWTAGDETVNPGDEVIVYGQIVNYKGNTPETNQNTGYLVEIVEYAPTISNVTVNVEGGKVTFTASYTNKSNVTISKAGFKYGEYDKTVNVPTGTAGEITAVIEDLAPGMYSVKAYLNDLESATAATFKIAGSDDDGGEESVVYTLDTTGSLQGSNNNYASSCDIANDGVTWTLEGNSTINPWRLGGKNTNTNNTDRALYSKTAIAENISMIEVEHGNISGITVNSFKVIVAKDAEFEQVVSTLEPSCTANATATILRPAGADWSNCYYKFVYNLTATSSSNGYVQFKKATFTGK